VAQHCYLVRCTSKACVISSLWRYARPMSESESAPGSSASRSLNPLVRTEEEEPPRVRRSAPQVMARSPRPPGKTNGAAVAKRLSGSVRQLRDCHSPLWKRSDGSSGATYTLFYSLTSSTFDLPLVSTLTVDKIPQHNTCYTDLIFPTIYPCNRIFLCSHVPECLQTSLITGDMRSMISFGEDQDAPVRG